MKKIHTHPFIFASIIVMLLWTVIGCSPTRHVPEGEYLLDKVKIETVGDGVEAGSLRTYIQQNPNYRILGFIPWHLTIYNLSGKDTTNRVNRWLRKIGNEPVIYDENAMDATCQQLTKALANMGYMHADVEADTVSRNRRMSVTYRVTPNEPFYIDTIIFNIPHATIDSIIRTQPSILKEGMLLDRSLLNKEIDRITQQLHKEGYYTFGKELITFNADTIDTSRAVELTVTLRPMPRLNDNTNLSYEHYKAYSINKVFFITDPSQVYTDLSKIDTGKAEAYKYINIIYGDERYITPTAMADNCFIMPGEVYSSTNVERTYTSFGRLSYLKSVNIRFLPFIDNEGQAMLDCYIFLNHGKSQTVSIEVEGTNSEGDLGAAAQVTYQHRNLFKGSETFTAEVRGAYENISGTMIGNVNDNYTEVGGRLGLKFPKFMFPFIKKETSRRLPATTEFDASINYQKRPEYTRIIAGAAWRYNWTRGMRHRHRLDLLDINYVYLPQYMDGFLEEIAPANPILRYSYEDHFIMSIGYNYYTSNVSNTSPLHNKLLRNAYTLRTSVETAGNILYGISNALGSPSDDGYKIFGIRYSQYVKGNIDYSYLHNFNEHHCIAFHAGFGIGIPYGNSSVLPFEKRFYSGGANSVRGWSVRALGPGSYNGQNNINSFIYQCGDVRLDLNVEYRAKLFWKIESALFIDAGNIWTIADYETQPGGVFRLNSFYKQIALAYGLGVRLNFDFMVIRADFGMKAYNPADGEVKWAIAHPIFKRDFAWHISIGYPF